MQTDYIRTESVPKNGLTATLFYLAERRFIELKQVNDKQWNIRSLAERKAWADIDPVSVAVGAASNSRFVIPMPRVGSAASAAARSAARAGSASASTTSETSPHACASAAVNRRPELIHSNARAGPSSREMK